LSFSYLFKVGGLSQVKIGRPLKSQLERKQLELTRGKLSIVGARVILYTHGQRGIRQHRVTLLLLVLVEKMICAS
jgi:hypothetical protein